MADVTVPVTIAGELIIKIGDLPQMALEGIKSALTFPNDERAKQARERIHGWWDLPETIVMWSIERRRGGDEVICLPRGFAPHLVAGMTNLGITIEWDDRRSISPAAEGYYEQFVLRDYQLTACVELLKAQQGFYKAPAGSGKTVAMLGMLAYINQRALVIVDKAGLVEQWRLRAARLYGMSVDVDEEGNETASLEGDRSVGKIGEDVWEERDLTICLRQTLHARGWSLDATKWWASWGVTIFDEGHHLAAETLTEICRKTTSFYLFGTSATPAPTETRGQIVHSLVGPIVHETPREILYQRGILMRPTVHVLDSEFKADFWDTHDSRTVHEDDGTVVVKCDVPNCPKSRQGKKHMHKNNYQSVLKKLVESVVRNRQIAERVVAQRGHIHLVGSRQLKHLKLLKEACIEAGWPEDHIWMLRGEENARGESQAIAQAIERAHEGIVFSTVADEALDIPPIDRVWSVFPMRQDALVIQYSGRGERSWPGKEQTVIVDVHDPGCEIFDEQHQERCRVYTMQGYPIMPAPAVEPIDAAELVTLHEREDGATEFRLPTKTPKPKSKAKSKKKAAIPDPEPKAAEPDLPASAMIG